MLCVMVGFCHQFQLKHISVLSYDIVRFRYNLSSLFSVADKLEPISADFEREAGYTVDQSSANRRAHILEGKAVT